MMRGCRGCGFIQNAAIQSQDVTERMRLLSFVKCGDLKTMKEYCIQPIERQHHMQAWERLCTQLDKAKIQYKSIKASGREAVYIKGIDARDRIQNEVI